MANVTNTYAASLYQIAKEANKSGEMYEQLQALEEIFAQNEKLFQMLVIPALDKGEKKELLNQIFAGKIDPFLLNFLKVLIDNKRISAFSLIAADYKRHILEEKNIVEVFVTTAKPLSEAQREKLKTTLQTQLGRTISLFEQVDEKILGGLVLRVGNQQMDASVKNKLENIAKQIRA